ncbi:transcriptional activator Mta [Mucilaginibacter puniceus]
MNTNYTVKQLAKMAGISVRTLHLYDKMKLLRPAIRTRAGYRLYSEAELLRLQQILFYKELDFALKDIKQILDEPDFDVSKALESHKKALGLKKSRINTLLKTIDNTLHNLKNKTMMNADELYDGLSPQQAAAYRKEAIETYGKEVVEHAETHLKKLDKAAMQALVAKQKDLAQALYLLYEQDPTSPQVQELISRHYMNTRKLWGTEHAADKQAEAYKGLGNLYLTDERFNLTGDENYLKFAAFIKAGMAYFADHQLS